MAFGTSNEPDHWNYWRREALAYQTGLAATVYASAGIVAPDLLEANPRADGAIELWLADVAGTAGWDWPVPRLARFAYELGDPAQPGFSPGHSHVGDAQVDRIAALPQPLESRQPLTAREAGPARPQQPRQCGIVAVITATMWHRNG
jgi:hypothetical protein